jgi:hypothetical protein
MFLLLAIWSHAASNSLAADDDVPPDEPDIEYRIPQVAAGSGGVYTYKAGEWGLLRLILINKRDVPVELDCATYFDSEDTLQYGRRIWMPPMSRLTTSHPILLPAIDNPDGTPVPFHTQVSTVGEGDQELVRDEVGKILYASDLQIQKQQYVTGVIGPYGASYDSPAGGITPHDLITMGRIEIQLPRRLSRYGDRVLPESELGLETLDQLVLADDRFMRDAAAVAAIRTWLYNGGRLWIMLDLVDPELLDVILGDASGCQVVDDVTLNQLEFSSPNEIGGFPDIVSEHEQPLKLVRVVLDDEEVPVFVNGWPAAFQKRCGAGRLLVTTLQADAWLTRKSAAEIATQSSEDFWPYSPTPPFQHLMSFFFQEPVESVPVAATFEPKLREFVGYAIPERGTVIGLLAGFLALLIGGGYWLLKGGRLERLALLTPVVAIVAASVLILIGRQHRQAVPPSTALLQVVHPIPGTDSVSVVGSAALYSPDSVTSKLQGADGGFLRPDLEGTQGTKRRMIWTDMNKWEWQDLPQPPGLRTAEFQVSTEVPERVSAWATFGPEGLIGHVSTPEGVTPADAIIATQGGRIAVELQQEGEFVASSDEVLGPDEYLRAGLLNDDQARRNTLLAELYPPSEQRQLREPTLMFWTDPWDAGLQFADGNYESGMALVVVPLDLERPPAGTEVSLPSPLVPYREASGPDGYQPSGLFDARKGAWAPRARPSTSWLRFEWPGELQPIDVKSARLEIRVTGPMGKIELSMARGGEVVPLETFVDPVGSVSFELDETLLDDPEFDDGLLLRLFIGDPDRPELTQDPDTGKMSYWRVESLDLEVDAVVLPREPQKE